MAPKPRAHKKEGRGKRVSKAKVREIIGDAIAKAFKAGRVIGDSDIELLTQSDPRLNGNVDRAIRQLISRKEIKRTKDGYRPA